MKIRNRSKFILFITIGCLFLMISCSDTPKTEEEKIDQQATIQDSTHILSQEEQIPSFENYCKSIIPNSEIEFFTIEWPGDDMLCEAYEGSEGPLHYKVCRLKQSKKIVYVTESGAYCQGDSEFSRYYLFDENGYVIYSEEQGLYNPSNITFYEAGKPIIRVEYPGEGEDTYERRTLKISSSEQLTATQFESKIDGYRQQMKSRIASLKSTKFETEGEKDEALKTISLLESSYNKKTAYEDGYIFRKPMVDEFALLSGRDIRVRTSPNSTAEVKGKVSYYNTYIKIQDIQGMEDIQPFGKHPWYNIQYVDASQKLHEGWVFGAFIVPNVYTK